MKTKTIIFLLIAATLVFGLFKLLKPSMSSDALVPPPAETVTKIYNINVVRGKIVSGATTLTVNEGDNVMLNFTLDKAEEIHLH